MRATKDIIRVNIDEVIGHHGWIRFIAESENLMRPYKMGGESYSNWLDDALSRYEAINPGYSPFIEFNSPQAASFFILRFK